MLTVIVNHFESGEVSIRVLHSNGTTVQEIHRGHTKVISIENDRVTDAHTSATTTSAK